MAYLNANFASGTIAAGGLAIGGTTLNLTAGQGARFPTITGSDFTHLVIQNTTGTTFEIVKVTAHAAAADSMTIVRAQEGTAAAAWLQNDIVGLRGTAGVLATLEGTQVLKNKDVEVVRADVASAGTCNIGAAATMHVRITGTTTINSFGTGTPGKVRFLEFQSALTLAMASTYLPSLETQVSVGAGDRAVAIADAAGTFYIHSYQRKNGHAINGGASALPFRQGILQAPTTFLDFGLLNGAGGQAWIKNGDFSTTAFIALFAAGYDTVGGIDYFSKSNSVGGGIDIQVASSGTSYIYAELTSTTGTAVTFGYSTLKPIYQFGGTISVTSGQHTYDIRAGIMYVGTGAATTRVNRVFIGECDAAGAGATVIRQYAIGDRYVGSETAIPAAGTATTFTHGLGTDPKFYQCECKLVCQTGEFSYVTGDVIDANQGASTGGINGQPLVTAYDRASGFFGYDDIIQVRTRGTPGTINTLTAANWRFVPIVYRGW